MGVFVDPIRSSMPHPPSIVCIATGLLVGLCVNMRCGWAQQDSLTNSRTANITISVPYKGKHYVGRPIGWDGRELLLLRRDGKLNILPVQSEADYTAVSHQFRPLTHDKIRDQLEREFGGAYQISVTPHFVVVHPPGNASLWAMPFEKLYSRFRLYFTSRGLRLNEPEFPLVAVVLRTRDEFDRFLRNRQEYKEQILGYYSPMSNRVITYDARPNASSDQDWLLNESTIIHEATHQAAFNTGLHSRFAPVPRWISEGLAMMFEAPGVNNSASNGDFRQRVNRDRWRELVRFYDQGKVDGRLAELIRNDDLFRTDPSLAYALAWGLTFYLCEQRPQPYFQFLSTDSQRTHLTEFPDDARLKAFGEAFGYRLDDTERRMKGFILGIGE